MEPGIQATGRRISSMGMALSLGPMELSMKASTQKERRTALESSCGATAAIISENFIRITYRGMVSISGLMPELLKASGTITKCTEKASSLGPTGESMRAITKTIRKKASESFFGPTVGNTLADGKTGSNTASALIFCQQANRKWGNGPMVSDFIGWKRATAFNKSIELNNCKYEALRKHIMKLSGTNC